MGGGGGGARGGNCPTGPVEPDKSSLRMDIVFFRLSYFDCCLLFVVPFQIFIVFTYEFTFPSELYWIILKKGLDKGYFDRTYGTFLLWLC